MVDFLVDSLEMNPNPKQHNTCGNMHLGMSYLLCATSDEASLKIIGPISEESRLWGQMYALWKTLLSSASQKRRGACATIMYPELRVHDSHEIDPV